MNDDHLRGARLMVQVFGEGLDKKIRQAAVDMLSAQDAAARARLEQGPESTIAKLWLVEMSLSRGLFLGLVDAYELVTKQRYPVEEVQSGWLDKP